MRLRLPLLAAIAAALALGACDGGDDGGGGGAPDRPALAKGAVGELPAPFAVGNSAGNIALDSRYRLVMVRWVARRTGMLEALHLRIQADGSRCRQSGRKYYGAGNGGSWLVTTHPVADDGRPDPSKTLATQRLRPCEGPTDVVDVRQGVTRLEMGLRVERGEEYGTVIRNGDPDAGKNYSSPNFLFVEGGIEGANGRNERSRSAPDAYYGLDPRELVGQSVDGGKRWSLPGGPYGKPRGRNFLPAYLQEYAGGQIVGQPYYYAAPAGTERAMLFRNGDRPWDIQGLGVYTPKPGRGTLTLSVDGREHARVTVAGGAGIRRVPIDPVTAPPGATVRVAAAGLEIMDVVADTAWGRLMKMHEPGTPWRIEGGENFSAAAPVYPLPPPPSATP